MTDTSTQAAVWRLADCSGFAPNGRIVPLLRDCAQGWSDRPTTGWGPGDFLPGRSLADGTPVSASCHCNRTRREDELLIHDVETTSRAADIADKRIERVERCAGRSTLIAGRLCTPLAGPGRFAKARLPHAAH